MGGALLDLVESAENGEKARSWFSDEIQVLAGVDAQALQDRRQVIRYRSLLALDDRAAGPVDQFQIVGRGIWNGFFGVVFAVALEAEELDDGLVQRGVVGDRFRIVKFPGSGLDSCMDAEWGLELSCRRLHETALLGMARRRPFLGFSRNGLRSASDAMLPSKVCTDLIDGKASRRFSRE